MNSLKKTLTPEDYQRIESWKRVSEVKLKKLLRGESR